MKQLFTILFVFSLFNLAKSQANFITTASGNWTAPSTWSITAGTDVDGIPDKNDDVTIVSGHTLTVNASPVYTKTLTIQSNAVVKTTSGLKRLGVNGDFINNGNIASTSFDLYMQYAGGTFYSPVTYNPSGTIWIQKNTTILANTVINIRGAIKLQNNNTTVTNYGFVTTLNPNNISLIGTVYALNSNNVWTNMSGSSLTINQNTSLTPALFNCSASSNTVTYAGMCNTVVPTTYDNLTITGSRSYTLTGNTTVNSTLTCSLATTPTLRSIYLNNKKITLKGDFVSSATMISQGNDTLVFTGSKATQTVSGTVSNTFAKITINKSNSTDQVLFTKAQRISKELEMIKGTCNANSQLVLLSDATNTAYITKIVTPSDVNFIGNMTIQKYLPYEEGDAYDYFYHGLASPVQSTTINDWDNELYISGIGPYDGQDGPVGVDGEVYNGFASMSIYDEPTDTWPTLTGSTTTLTPAQGYCLLLLDTVNSSDGTGKSYAKTLTTVGTPNFGNVTIPVTYDYYGSNFVGNPYASPIKLSVGLIDDPVIDALYFLHEGDWLDADDLDFVIPPHQGFFIDIENPGDLTFSEDCKVADNTSAYYRKQPKYDIKLNISGNSVNYSHEARVCFDDKGSVNYDKKLDAKYIKSPAQGRPAIYTFDELTGVNILKNTVNNNSDELTIPIAIYTPKTGMYRLNSSVVSMGNYNYAWIENKTTGQKYDLNNDIAIEGQEAYTNKDYVLHLTTKRITSSVEPTILTNDLMVFSTENTINLKSTYTDYVITNLLVYDMSGKLVLEHGNMDVNAGQISKIDVSNLANGLYIIKTFDNQGKTTTHKLIK